MGNNLNGIFLCFCAICYRHAPLAALCACKMSSAGWGAPCRFSVSALSPLVFGIIVLHRIFHRFANKASLHRKQGFFTLQTTLVFIANKPCF